MTSASYKRNVYILGAGFSVAAGAPVMANFFDAMQECFFSGILDDSDKNAFQFALEFRKEMASASDNFVVDLENLEQLFGHLEMQITAGKRTSQHRRQFIQAVLRTLELKIRPSRKRDDEAFLHDGLASGAYRILELAKKTPFESLFPSSDAWIYHLFAVMVAKTHLGASGKGDSIITFNYDLLLDQAFTEIRVPVAYHNGINSTTSDYPHFAYAANIKVPLYKLHGSANWIHCDKHDRNYCAPPMPPPANPPYSLLRSSRMACPECNKPNMKPVSGNPDDHTPLIVPPTWNKAAWQIGLESVWKAAIEDLSSAGRIIVIGFSLPETDLFFRYLLAAGVPVGRGVDVFLFDPSDAVEGNYTKFLAPVFSARRFNRVTHLDYNPGPFWKGHFNLYGIWAVAQAAGLL